MPPPRPKKQKREHSESQRRPQRQQQQQHNDDDDSGDRQQRDTQPLSPPSRPATQPTAAHPRSSGGVAEPAQPAPIEQLQLSSLSSRPPLSSSSVSSLSAPSASRATAKLYIVLVKAGLETIKTKKGHELVTADTHSSLLLRLKKEPSEFRPDIVHQCLLTLLDSPLNKAGLLQVLVQTDSNVLIEVNPATRIPRTFKRFAGLMVQLLHKLKIRSTDSNDYLLRVIRNPVTDHLPPSSLRLGTSSQATLVDIHELAQRIGGGKPRGEGLRDPIVLCVGSHASGPAEVDWTERSISVSQYPLSASVALGRMLNAFEHAWSIL